MKKHLTQALRGSGIFLLPPMLPAMAVWGLGWVALQGANTIGIILAGVVCVLTISGFSDLTK